MILLRILSLTLIVSLLSCANPLNRATYYDYKKQGEAGEARGDWHTAEIAYYRAAENVRWGNLGPAYESTSLYNLGRAKRFVGKLDESEQLLSQALAIDEKLYGPDGPYTAATISELAATCYLAKQFDRGVPLMLRLETLIQNNPAKYAPQTQSLKFVTQLFGKYAEAMRNQGSTAEAERFQSVATRLAE